MIAAAVWLALASGTAPSGPAVPAERLADAHPLLPVLCETMRGALAALDPGGDPAATAPRPTLVSYRVVDGRAWRLTAGFGALEERSASRDVRASVQMRVGDLALDNTHHLPGDRMEGLRILGSLSTVSLPTAGDAAGIRRILEDETDKLYARAVSDLGAVKAARAVKAQAEDPSPDLSSEEPERSLPALERLAYDPAPWEERLRRVSAVFRAEPDLLGGEAWLRVEDQVLLLVTSEGTVIQERRPRAFTGVRAWTRTADGEDLVVQRDAYAPEPGLLPGQEALERLAAETAAAVLALRRAPPAEPYVGPLLLAGRAAAVLFHEVLGHPLEGERQRAEDQGQTFRGKVGERILPAFLSVTFDPALRTLGTTRLAGAYDHDDEGIAARRVVAVEQGVLRSFLMSRRPVAGFPRSNGHGRAEAGRLPVARQSNLLITAEGAVEESSLRRMLIERARERGLAFGLYVSDVQGGATRTARGEPNAFNVVPVEVFRVHVDGRPDELVRGAELVGTPLLTLQTIVAAGDRTETFNGTCGAESGWLPVSASSPALLLGEIEVQRRAKSQASLPLLPPPTLADSTRESRP